MATALYVLEYIFLAFPQYTFCSGLVNMTKSFIQAEIFLRFGDDTFVSPFSLQVLGWNIIVLAFQGGFFFVINLMLEYMPQVLIWIERRLVDCRIAISSRVITLFRPITLNAHFIFWF